MTSCSRAWPDLQKLAETYAISLLSDEDRSAVADDVEEALQGWDIEELNGRAWAAGRGYVDPGEAADEILDEAFGPFLEDLERRAKLGIELPSAELRDLVPEWGTMLPWRSVAKPPDACLW